MQNPDLFVEVSLSSGIHRAPRAVADRGGWKPLGKAKRKRRTPKPRVKIGAATPTPEPEIVSGDTSEE